MRILQLIDTLRPGGAERMAVNYANTLVMRGHESFLVTTRGKGSFVDKLDNRVSYHFLNRKGILDLKAIWKFGKILKKNRIEFVHAHGTSWFFGVICKLLFRHHKFIWHIHSGNIVAMKGYRKSLLNICSLYFDGVISVNNDLYNWAKNSLQVKNYICLANFITQAERRIDSIVSEKFNIVCVANLRPEKNHLLLVSSSDYLIKSIPIHIHIVGKDFNSDYSKNIIKEFNKRNHITYHGSPDNIENLLGKMQLGVLVSNYEGMPMSILEYGAIGLPVIATRVGACSELLKNYGILIAPNDLNSLRNAIKTYYYDYEKAKNDALKFHKFVLSNFSQSATINRYLKFCNELC